MSNPTSEQIAKLPAWAREHIYTLSRERREAIRVLNDFQNSDIPSPFYFEKNASTGEEKGINFKRHYIQSHRVYIEHRGVKCEISAQSGGLSGVGVRLKWEHADSSSELAFIPDCHQSAFIVTKDDMR
jgi:hypothetical protein